MSTHKTPLIDDCRLRQALTEVEKQENFSGLLNAVSRYRRAATGIGDTYDSEILMHLDPSHLGGSRIGVVQALLGSLTSEVTTLRHILAFDAEQLLELIHIGLASRRFRFVVFGVRGFLERSGITEMHVGPMRPSFASIARFPSSQFLRGNLPAEEFSEHLKVRVSASRALRRYLISQSFNWSSFDATAESSISLKKGDPKKQFQASDGIKSLSWTGPHPESRNLYWHYNLLSEYVHPNLGASNLFVDLQQVFELRAENGQENSLIKRRLSRMPDHPSALAHVLTLIYHPWREALSWTASHLEWLTTEQKKCERDIRVFEKARLRETE